jgi:hypothetical protein
MKLASAAHTPDVSTGCSPLRAAGTLCDKLPPADSQTSASPGSSRHTSASTGTTKRLRSSSGSIRVRSSKGCDSPSGLPWPAGSPPNWPPVRRRACAPELQLNTPRACNSTRDSALHPYSGLLGSVVEHAVTKSACHGAWRSRSGARLRASQSFRRRFCAPGARQCASLLRRAPAVLSGRPNPLRSPTQPPSQVERPWIPHEQAGWPRQESNLRTRIRRLLAKAPICRGKLVDVKAARQCGRHSRVSCANDGASCND